MKRHIYQDWEHWIVVDICGVIRECDSIYDLELSKRRLYYTL